MQPFRLLSPRPSTPSDLCPVCPLSSLLRIVHRHCNAKKSLCFATQTIPSLAMSQQQPASSSSSSAATQQPRITTALKCFFFANEEKSVLMDCLLPSAWCTAQESVAERVCIEQESLLATQQMVFDTIERLILQYSLSPELPLPLSHAIFVFDSSLTAVVKDLYLRIKRDIVDKHKAMNTFPSQKERARFREVAQYFTVRSVLTNSMFLDLADKQIYAEKGARTHAEDNEPRTLHLMIPFAARHARVSFALRLQEIVPRFADNLVLRPLSPTENTDMQKDGFPRQRLVPCRFNAFTGCTLISNSAQQQGRKRQRGVSDTAADASIPKRLMSGRSNADSSVSSLVASNYRTNVLSV